MSNQSITIQKLTLTDADTLLPLSRKTFFDFFGPLNTPENMEAYAAVAFKLEKIKDELSNPDSHFYFAILNNEITGYLKLNFNNAQTELQDPKGMEIERIYLLDEYKGKKIGGQLLNFAIQMAKAAQMEYIWLGVWEHNHPALGFYKHNGFEVFSSHKFTMGDDEQTDLLMKKAL